MSKPQLDAAGGFAAIRHVASQARDSGQPKELLDRLRSANTCKPCAIGMGGELGGMVDEAGHFPETCKKSVQAQVADLQGAIPESFFETTGIATLLTMTSREVENLGRLAFRIARSST